VGGVSSEHRGWDEVVLQWNSQLVQSADHVNFSIELRADEWPSQLQHGAYPECRMDYVEVF
jgi:hypothetical protein